MATLILENALILPCDPAMTVIDTGHIVLDGPTIVSVAAGPVPEEPALAGVERRDCGGRLVMPGMVNTHAHLAMTLFRGLGEDVEDRLYRYILPLERAFVTPDMVRVGTALAAVEMIAGGVTTSADMYYFETEVGAVLDQAGLRALVGQTLADFDPPDHRSFDEGFARVDALVERFAGHPRITASIAPHAPYSTDIAVMARVAAYAEAHPEVPVQIHLAEMDSELDWCARHHGLRPVGVVAKAGLLRPGLIAAHGLHLDPDEIALLGEVGVGVAHNARSNGKGGRGIAPVEALRAAGVAVGLASDGPMSGNTLDLFAQFAPASMFAKLRGRSRKPLPAREIIRMATLEGARVLSLDHRIGSIEPGKRADLIVVDISAPRLQPIYDPYSALVFAALPTDVVDVMVDGIDLMRNRAILRLDVERTLADASRIAATFRGAMAEIDRAARADAPS
jgi:cytosine/adenosine deaminase-related metal-dependent hydrolase